MSYDENYLMHHGIKGMKWGVRRYRNYDGTLTSAGKAQRKAENSRSSGGRKGMSDSTKKKLKTAAKVAAGVAGAAALAGGAYYLAKSGKGAKMLSAVGSASRNAKALPAKGMSTASKGAGRGSAFRDAVGKAGSAVKGAGSKVADSARSVAGSAKSKVQNARDMANIRKASAYKRKYGVNALPGTKTSMKDRLGDAARSARYKASRVRDTLDNASRGIDDGTRLGRAASAVGAAGQRAKRGASNVADAAKTRASNLRDRAAVAKAARYRKKYGVNALPGAASGNSVRDNLREAVNKVQGRAANATRGARTAASVARDRVGSAARSARDTATKARAAATRRVAGSDRLGTGVSTRERFAKAARRVGGAAANATQGARTTAGRAANVVRDAGDRARSGATSVYAKAAKRVGGNRLGDGTTARQRLGTAARNFGKNYGKAAVAGAASVAGAAGAAAYQRKKTLNTPEKRARYEATRSKAKRRR